jgi:predicted N-acyltransferase
MSESERASGSGDYCTRVVTDLAQVDAVQWDELVGTGPFTRHAFLSALQNTGCVGGESGWHQHVVCIDDAAGRLVAAAPMYLKDHSYGEYVFDWAWADAYHRNRLPYYPKALVAVPFTPVPGPRLLARDDRARALLVEALIAETDRLGVSGLHVLFPESADARALEAAGMMRRQGVQFHWMNAGWPDFEAFLGDLSQPKRKKIRAERRKVANLADLLDKMFALDPAHRITVAQALVHPFIKEVQPGPGMARP